MPFVERFPVRSHHEDTIVVAGRFFANGNFTSAVELPKSKIIAGKGFRVVHGNTGFYAVFLEGNVTANKSAVAYFLSGDFVIRSPQGTLSVGCAGPSFTATNQTALTIDIRNSSFNQKDLASTDVIAFMAVFRLVKQRHP